MTHGRGTMGAPIMPGSWSHDVAPGRTVCTLRVGGMDCSSCAESVELALRQLEGVQDVRVDVVGERVTVGYLEGKLARGDLVGAITRIGYRVEDEAPVEGARASLGIRARLAGEERKKASWSDRRVQLGLAALAGLFWTFRLAAESALRIEAVAAAFALGAVIALMADDLSKLPVAIRLARKAERIIRANIGFSLVVKAAFVLLAVTGWATLWMAVLADMGASLLVIMNGLRALRPPRLRTLAAGATALAGSESSV